MMTKAVINTENTVTADIACENLTLINKKQALA